MHKERDVWDHTLYYKLAKPRNSDFLPALHCMPSTLLLATMLILIQGQRECESSVCVRVWRQHDATPHLSLVVHVRKLHTTIIITIITTTAA